MTSNSDATVKEEILRARQCRWNMYDYKYILVTVLVFLHYMLIYVTLFAQANNKQSVMIDLSNS